jgi:hypothetical protein
MLMFCPTLAIEVSKMKEMTVTDMLQALIIKLSMWKNPTSCCLRIVDNVKCTTSDLRITLRNLESRTVYWGREEKKKGGGGGHLVL